MKKIFLVALFFVTFSLAPHVLAQTTGPFVPLSSIPGLTDIQPTQGGLAVFFNNLYKYLIGLSATLAVIMIIWGGLEYSTQDSVSKKSDGKQRIYQAIFGLVLVLSPVLVFSIINPTILNLSIDLPPITTASSTPSGGGATTPQTPATGCQTNSLQNSYLRMASCATSQDAQNYQGCFFSNNPSVTALPKRIRCAQGIATQGGTCVNGYQVECGSQMTVQHSIQLGTSGLLTNSEQPVPDDAQKEQSFTSGCTTEGGQVSSSASISGKTITSFGARLATKLASLFSGLVGQILIAAAQTRLLSCPSNVTYNQNQSSGVFCYRATLQCTLTAP